MQKSEYKTITLELSSGVTAKGYAGLDEALNLHAAEGWRLAQIIEPVPGFGETRKLIVVLERAVSCA